MTNFLNSSAFRITLIYVVLFTFSVFILFGFFYWSTFGYLVRQKEETINAEIATLQQQYERGGFISLRLHLSERISNQTPGDASIYLLVDDRYRHVMGNLDRWPGIAFDKDGWLDFKLHDTEDDSPNGFEARFRALAIGNRYYLLVGQSMEDLDRVHKQLIKTLFWGLIMMGGLALLGAAMMRRTITRRLDGINRTSRQIMQGNIQERIESRGTQDEFDQLANNLNNMLDQIELGMNNVRRVSDNIAHDLKTPLARIKNRLEELRIQVAGVEDNEVMVNQIANDADRLLETFNALLRIARIEASERKEGFKEINLVSILQDARELYEPVTEEKNQEFVFSSVDSIVYSADRDMLFQAIANVLDNAVKYTPKNGVISLKAEKNGRKGHKIIISDTGPGIPDSEYPKVVQRFYRVDSSRTTPGSGLGLALVAAILQLHNMEMRFEDNQPGLLVEILIPRA
ncbi:MAG: sensor histidine kinase [Arenicella sp.]